MKANHIFLLFALPLLISAGCTSFSSLTTMDLDSGKAPFPADCGSCHRLQYQEWSSSRHAESYRNPSFFREYSEAGDEDCLNCHAPIGIVADNAHPRPVHVEDGVDCFSCHYAQGKMHGPHGSTALFSPHPIAENRHFFSGNSSCIPCHTETADEYEEQAGTTPPPACLECHGARVVRTASQGTGFFSNMLVGFESPHDTFSHTITLAPQKKGDMIEVAVHTVATDRIEIRITNGLPHNLPTGTFGGKTIQLHIELVAPNDTLLFQTTRNVSDESDPLPPSETRTFSVAIPDTQAGKATLHLTIERAATDSSRPDIRLAAQSLVLPAL